MKLLFGILFILIIVGIFTGAVVYLAQIFNEMGLTNLNFALMDFPW